LLSHLDLAVPVATSRDLVVSLIREQLERVRREARNGNAVPSLDALAARVLRAWHLAMTSSLQPVINATGVVLHTNLGRALLSDAAISALREAAGSYDTLEFDLASGTRGSRFRHTRDLLCRLTGAESAIVVNNNAAAVTLVLRSLANEHDVIVSRGQLVEIGGGFRVPEILAQSGARLIEVGTTNRTYVHDYERAINERTAALLRVHASNFRVIGFTHEASIEALAELGRQYSVHLLDDVGSGALLDTAAFGLAHEPMVQESVAAGADVTCFSGDKLLGGPQAGIIVGKASLIGEIERNPLTRALRVDKLILAALDATLRQYLLGEATKQIPIWQMISTSLEMLQQRAAALVAMLATRRVRADVVAGVSAIGGGSLPCETLPTALVRLSATGKQATILAGALRHGVPPVVARIVDNHVVLDPRTVLPAQDTDLCTAVERAVG
jgi:L-seryl-tRNA(Ser) seleniumtransferase